MINSDAGEKAAMTFRCGRASGAEEGMIISRKNSIGIVVILSAVVAAATAAAQSRPAVGNLQMPPVSPQQAEQFFATRTVPPSDVPAIAPLGAPPSQPPQKLDVEPVLGHDLPADPVTPGGLPRADFATAKPGGEQQKRPDSDSIVVAPRAPDTTVIREEPPVFGKP